MLFQTDLRRKHAPDGTDSDGDGISDVEEIENGLDPDNADSDNNGIGDGDEDPDGDGLVTKWEIAFGFDPFNADSASTKYGETRADNGISDCDEDIDGDGAGICWEMSYDFDPESNTDLTKDGDGDAFANAEEAPTFDPTDGTSRPGPEQLLVVTDDDLSIDGRTNAATVRGTFGYCNDGDQLLFTASSTVPEADAGDWVDCTTTAYALSTTLDSLVAGPHTVYVWRQNRVGVVESPVTATVVVDTAGPTGGDVAVSGLSSRTVDLAVTIPDGTAEARAFRFAGTTDCATSPEADGTEVAIVAEAIRDEGLALGQPYCYQVHFADDLGNFETAVASYDAEGPTPGTLSLGTAGALTINLVHAPPASFTSLALRRLAGTTSCDDAMDTDGTSIAIAAGDTAISDASALSVAVDYCYKVFWYDEFGNSSSRSVTFSKDGPTAGSIAVSSLDALTVNLTLTPPSDTTYSHATVARYASLTCNSNLEADGIAVPVTGVNVSDDGGGAPLVVGSPYCYRAFWHNEYGNVTPGGTAVYDATGPDTGTIAVASLGARTINLTLDPPSDPNYGSVTVARYAASTCTNETEGDGTLVTVTGGTSVADDGGGTALSLNQPYCYRSFWYDKFGNKKGGATALYDAAGPAAGTIAVTSLAALRINLTLTPPNDADYAYATVARYAELDCSSELESAGTAVTVTGGVNVSDLGGGTPLELDQPYCYRAFWHDAFGNATAGTTAVYNAVGPTAGSIAVTSLGALTVNLTLTPPNDVNYASATVARYAALSCSSELEAAGTPVTITGGVNISDNGGGTPLVVGQPYCYRAFWRDGFGNATAGTTAVYAATGPTAGQLAISSYGSLTINLTLTAPSDSTYSTVHLARYQAATCATSLEGAGTAVTVTGGTSASDDGGGVALSLATAYCYRAFWYDAFGNARAGSTAAYDGTGPTPGTVAITSFGPLTIDLTLTPNSPADADYDTVHLTRYTAACVASTEAAGTAVTVTANAASDDGDGTPLTTGQLYCYQAFWYDDFGNSTPSSTAATYTAVVAAGAIEVSDNSQYTSLTFTHTPSGDANYDHVIVRKSLSPAACPTGGPSAGSSVVAVDKDDTSFTDTGLANNSLYCYEAYWFDTFGNYSHASSDGTPASRTAELYCYETTGTRHGWYVGASVALTYQCNAMFTPVAAASRPGFLGAPSVSGQQVSFSGTAATPGAAVQWSFTLNGIQPVFYDADPATTGDVLTELTSQVFDPTGLSAVLDQTPAISMPTNNMYDDTGGTPWDFTNEVDLDDGWDGSSSNATLSWTAVDSDIADLHVASSCSPSVPALPYLCGGTVSLAAGKIVQQPIQLGFGFSAFDQGPYRLKLTPQVTLDSVNNALSTVTVTTYTVPRQTTGNVPVTTTGTVTNVGIESAWSNALAVSPALSDATTPVAGLLFFSKAGTEKSFFQRLTIHRDSDPDSTTGADSLLAGSIVTQNTASSQDFVVRPIADGDWAVTGLVFENPYRSVVFNRVNDDTSAPSLEDYNSINGGHTDASYYVTTVADTNNDDVTASDASEPFVASGTKLGVAYAYLAGVAGTFDVYARLIDVDAPDTASSTTNLTPSHPTSMIDRVKIRYAAEDVGGGMTGALYVAYRQGTGIRFGKLKRDLTAIAVEKAPAGLSAVLEDADTTSNFETIDFAVGEVGTGTFIPAVVYRDTTDDNCYFARLDASIDATSLIGPTQINDDTDSGDCRVPQIHFNPNSDRFLVTYGDKIGVGNFEIRSVEIAASGVNNTITRRVETNGTVVASLTTAVVRLSTSYYSTGNWMALVYRRDTDATIRVHGFHVSDQ